MIKKSIRDLRININKHPFDNFKSSLSSVRTRFEKIIEFCHSLSIYTKVSIGINEKLPGFPHQYQQSKYLNGDNIRDMIFLKPHDYLS